METILLAFVKNEIHDLNIEIVNVTVESQITIEDYMVDRNLQLSARKYEVRGYSYCPDWIDFQSQLNLVFESSEIALTLIDMLRASSMLGNYFENGSIIVSTQGSGNDYSNDDMPTAIPTMTNNTFASSEEPSFKGSSAGTVGAATIAGVGAAAISFDSN